MEDELKIKSGIKQTLIGSYSNFKMKLRGPKTKEQIAQNVDDLQWKMTSKY